MQQTVPAQAQPLLRVENLQTHLYLRRGVLKAVDGVSLAVGTGETLGLVGESGCGKTMTCLSILRLLPKQSGRIVEGQVWLDGIDLTRLPEQEMARQWRGRRVAMVTQDPMTSLNPVFTVGDQVGAPLRAHGLASGARGVRDAAVKVLRHVRIPSAETRLDDYPHQFSGGMRQRVVSAMALACQPRLLILDEPTSNLDVTIQVQMIELFRELQNDSGLGIILITHDLGVAAAICHRVAVMYAGRIVEVGDVRTIYRRAAHPYTRALLDSIPHLGVRRERLASIGGQPPSLIDPPSGCRFAPRCAHRTAQCEREYPPEIQLAPHHTVACWHPLHEQA
ncbi:MAG: ABC transporter ATP-binding protein [Betaproteobacteria bacterium]|nr:ABC transporter ATP-binding protein [Betaproteobacteria bacterium]